MEKEKIQNLISQMTLEEKAGMCSGADFWHLKGIERLGIPQVMVTDGPHGIRKQAEEADHLGINESEKAICFPAGCATASSFDRDLIRRQGELLGQECQAMNVSTILGPAMNIKRSPLCGRNFECVDKGFKKDEQIQVVIRPEDIKMVDSEKGMLKGEVTSCVFKGVHYEMTVESCGLTWLLHNTKSAEVGSTLGMDIYPEDIHIMKKTGDDE